MCMTHQQSQKSHRLHLAHEHHLQVCAQILVLTDSGEHLTGMALCGIITMKPTSSLTYGYAHQSQFACTSLQFCYTLGLHLRHQDSLVMCSDHQQQYQRPNK